MLEKPEQPAAPVIAMNLPDDPQPAKDADSSAWPLEPATGEMQVAAESARSVAPAALASPSKTLKA